MCFGSLCLEETCTCTTAELLRSTFGPFLSLAMLEVCVRVSAFAGPMRVYRGALGRDAPMPRACVQMPQPLQTPKSQN